MLHLQKGEEPSPGSMEVAETPGLATSPQSEAVTSELQELSLQPGTDPMPLRERKNGETMLHINLLQSAHLIPTVWCYFGQISYPSKVKSLDAALPQKLSAR